MPDGWRFLDIYLPAGMSRPEATAELRRRVALMAADGGEFVRQFRIGDRHSHTEGWNRWTASYLPGPPRIGQFYRDMNQQKASVK